VSREIQVPASALEDWRRAYLDGAEAGLKRRTGDPMERELVRTRAKLGEVMMRLELSEELLEKRGYGGRAEEALEARSRVSPTTGRPYPLTLVCSVYRLARSTVYERAGRGSAGGRQAEPRKRGPRTPLSDEALVEEIRTVLRDSSFLSEGHRKVRAHLGRRGMRVGKNRVLRLMRENGLLAPVRKGHPRGDRSHSGTIRTQRPDELWGTDATRFWSEDDGWCWFFAAIDHCTDEIVGWHVAKEGDRWAALEPIRQGVQGHFGSYTPKIALGLGLRHDWGPQYTAGSSTAS
jgi:putative transposase